MKLVRVVKKDAGIPEGNKREVRILIGGLANKARTFANELDDINKTFDGKYSTSPTPLQEYYDTVKSECDYFVERIVKKYLDDIRKRK